MNCRAGLSESGRHGTASGCLTGKSTVNPFEKPKLLPWLARGAGMPEHAIHVLWNEALALAGVEGTQAGEPRRQAAAMQYVLLMLKSASGTPNCMAGEPESAFAATSM
jgi:hypothetical protein